MSDCPDVLGLELEEALAHLSREGWRVDVRTTAPPGGTPPGPRRVLRLAVIGVRRVEIVVAHQGWGEGTGRDVFPDHR